MKAEESKEIKPFFVMEILEKAQEMEKAGEDIIHLEIGEPDFHTPECIKEAAIQAIRSGKTKYTHSQGILPLREVLAQQFHEKYGVSISPGDITVTSGTSAAMSLVFSALLGNQEKVVIPNPCYPCYPSFIQSMGGSPLWVETEESEGFQLHPELLKEKIASNKDVKAIILNSPSNPTGQVTPAEKLKKLVDLGITLVSDEIYHGMTYGEKEHSILEFTDNAFVLNGFSKLHAMTGWRLGYLISPKKTTRLVQKLHQNLFISANSFVQWAGLAALTEAGPEIKAMVLEYGKRREIMLKGLKKLGFQIPVEPKGAFYVLVNARHINPDSLALANQLLKEAKVAVAPGMDFGSKTEGFLRFSYANSIEQIEEAMDRIGKFLGLA